MSSRPELKVSHLLIVAFGWKDLVLILYIRLMMSLDSSSFSQTYLREMEKLLESSIEETFTLLTEMMRLSLPALYVPFYERRQMYV